MFSVGQIFCINSHDRHDLMPQRMMKVLQFFLTLKT